MTREDGSCPDAEHQGEYCIEARTRICNGSGCRSVCEPAQQWDNGRLRGRGQWYGGLCVQLQCLYGGRARKLGQLVLDHLSAQLDLNPRGVFVRTKEEKGHYDDGSVQDWYYLISYSVEGGHPGMIIEHAYMDNPHDNAILKDEAQLKAMGTADADAIASYYNLQIKTKTEN